MSFLPHPEGGGVEWTLGSYHKKEEVVKFQFGPAAFTGLLKKHRKKKGLSQSKLAEATGFDHSSVSRHESGERFPLKETVLKYTTVLDLTEDERDELLVSAGYLPENPAYIINFFPREVQPILHLLLKRERSERDLSSIADHIRVVDELPRQGSLPTLGA